MSEYALILEVGGTRIEGWVSGHVNWRVEALCGGFTLQSRASASETPAALRLGAKCTLWAQSPEAKQKALVGVIDSISHEASAKNVRTLVGGRSTSADLVDCAPPLQVWRNQTALQIASALCEPHGIKVADEAGLTELFSDFATQPGEAIVYSLTRMARLRGAWVGDAAPDGGLRFFIPGQTRVPFVLEAGGHLLSIKAGEDRTKRFSQVLVLGETPAGDLIQAEALDGGSPKERQRVVLAEEPCLLDAMQTHANWERGLQLADSASASLEIRSWDALAGLLPLGGLVAVNAPQVGLVGQALVQGLSIFLDENGPRLKITLTHRAAFSRDASTSAITQPFLQRRA